MTSISNSSELNMPNAAAKVFSTFELLEAILIRAGTSCPKEEASRVRARNIKGLYRVQRVNKTFRDVIVRSKRLGELMFRATQESGGTYRRTPDDVDDWDRYLNPYARFLYSFVPLLDNDFKITSMDLEHGMYGAMTVSYTAYVVYPNDPIEQTRHSKSWSQMMIASKPICLTVVFKVYVRAQPFEAEFTLREGATLGELVERVIRLIRTKVDYYLYWM